MRDTEVVASIVAGDPNGLATAYDRYADPLFKYCKSLLRDPADAADAVQDTFVIAASRLDGLREPERFRAWLYAVARNESLRILRAKKGTSALDEAPDVTDDSADVTEHAHQAELRALFEEAAAGLNPGEREVIELQLRQGLEAGEVATVLGVSRNHAHSLLSRARDQLEACLGVLLVGRAGRGECGELGAMLAGWDGRLTVLLRKRVHRHIEHCATCTARRAFELRPAMLLDLSPGAAMAAGAAESFRLAFGVPPGLKAHTIALASGHGQGAAAHSTAVLSRAGAFGKQGFPRPAHAGLAGQHGVAGGVRALRSSPRGQAATAAAVVAAVAVAAVAFALTGRDEHFAPSANPKPPGSAPIAPPASAAAKPAATTSGTVRPATVKPTARKPSPAPPASAARASLQPTPTTASPSPAPTTARPSPAASTARPTPPPAPTTARPTPAPTRASPPPPPPPPPPADARHAFRASRRRHDDRRTGTGWLAGLAARVRRRRQLVGLGRQRPEPCRQRVPGGGGDAHAGRPGRHPDGQGQQVRAVRAGHRHAVPGDHDLARGRDVRRLDRLDAAVPARRPAAVRHAGEPGAWRQHVRWHSAGRPNPPHNYPLITSYP